MNMVSAALSLSLVAVAAVAGVVGTGLLFTALTDQVPVALLWGLPLALGGLYWCGRALAAGQRGARRKLALQRGASSGG